jgi:hypothetical protein
VCEHAAAAVIALRQARRAGERLPGASQPAGRVAVRPRAPRQPLLFERAIVVGDREAPLQSTLTALSSGRSTAPRSSRPPADLAVERALGTRCAASCRAGCGPPCSRRSRASPT